MQSQLSKYKEAAVDIHSLRADVESLTNVLGSKVGMLYLILFLDLSGWFKALFCFTAWNR